ncbi:predicted protein [Postia placenta Mad-698-R]|nr:predicted protein [Postia placenta Mad-698-R]
MIVSLSRAVLGGDRQQGLLLDYEMCYRGIYHDVREKLDANRALFFGYLLSVLDEVQEPAWAKPLAVPTYQIRALEAVPEVVLEMVPEMVPEVLGAGRREAELAVPRHRSYRGAKSSSRSWRSDLPSTPREEEGIENMVNNHLMDPEKGVATSSEIPHSERIVQYAEVEALCCGHHQSQGTVEMLERMAYPQLCGVGPHYFAVTRTGADCAQVYRTDHSARVIVESGSNESVQSVLD